MLANERELHYVEDEKDRLYLCPLDEFYQGKASRAELTKRCIDDEANINLHAYEGY